MLMLMIWFHCFLLSSAQVYKPKPTGKLTNGIW